MWLTEGGSSLAKQSDIRRVVRAYKRTKRLEADLMEARQVVRDEITSAHDDGATYQQIADALGISRERVRQLKNQ